MPGLAVGTDLVEVARVAALLSRPGFAERTFRPAEIAYCRSQAFPERNFAARLAAKEAVWKALSAAGVASSGWLPWLDVEITRDPSGRPGVHLHAALAELGAAFTLQVSLAHTDGLATATCVLIGREKPVQSRS